MKFFRPTESQIAKFLAKQQGRKESYAKPGMTMGECPPNFDCDHNRIELGRGLELFRRACDAMREWKMFPKPWTFIRPANAPIQQGFVIAMSAFVLGSWWVNACRIVYLIDELDPIRRFGFAYGTLPAHVEKGEERFLLEMDEKGIVYYDILAYSKPRHFLVRLMYPLARRMQKRFVRASQAAMREAIK